MEIFFGGDRETLEKKFFAMAAQCLADEARETVILVPAQASFLVESQLMKRCHVAGFLQLEVLSFEKLTERLLSRCGGRAIPALDKAGLCMLAKEALKTGKGIYDLVLEHKLMSEEELHKVLQPENMVHPRKKIGE